MAEEKSNVVPFAPKVITSMAEIEASQDVEYRLIEGFKDGEQVWIASVSAGDIIDWSEANEGEAKRTAGLRLICRSLISVGDASGVRYANDDKNIVVFRRKSHRRAEAIVREILDLNGMKKKQVEEAKKD